jgi:hypothetical protein
MAKLIKIEGVNVLDKLLQSVEDFKNTPGESDLKTFVLLTIDKDNTIFRKSFGDLTEILLLLNFYREEFLEEEFVRRDYQIGENENG